MNMRRAHRPGMTMPELLVGMIILAFVGMGFTRLLVSQTRFFDQQGASTGARNVARSSLNRVISDIRMVEAEGGVIAADAQSITMRVPYAIGVVCDAGTLAMLPADSAMYAEAPSAYAWRDGNGVYTYVTSSVAIGTGSASTCTGAGVTDLSAQGGKVVSIQPALPVGAAVGSPVFLSRVVRYEIKSSGLVAGKMGIFRTQTAPAGAEEEIAAPFSTDSRFRFFVGNASVAQDAAPADLTTLRGIELKLSAQSERAPAGSTGVRTEKLTTAVFFKNRRS